jgi:hypothetical protein
MANMSAEILRNIVAATFKINAREVILSGEISPKTSFQNSFWNGSMGESSTTRALYGWCATQGFVCLNKYVGEYSGSNYAHSQRIDEPGAAIAEIEGVEKYIFFFIIETVYSNWEGSQYENYTKYTLYKAPNFQEHLEKIETADVNRWQNWLKPC